MHSKQQRGFTLLELMISLTIGVVIIGGTVSMMRNSSKALTRHEGNADAVSAIRLASDMLRNDIQSAGYFGRTRNPSDIDGRTNSANNLTTITGDCSDLFYTDISRFVYASNNENPFSGTDGCIPDSLGYIAGTDVLVVRYAKDVGLSADGTGLVSDKVYVYSNPIGGELVRLNSMPSLQQFPTAGAFRDEIGKSFYELQTFVYFVGDNGSDGAGLYRLYLEPEGTNAFKSELVSTDITDLQVRFGVEDCDTSAIAGSTICDGGIDEYRDGWTISTSAGTPAYGDIAKIRTVAVGLTSISSSIQGADQMAQITHKMRGEDYTAPAAATFQATTFHVRNSESIF